jgi:hypothetical protein
MRAVLKWAWRVFSEVFFTLGGAFLGSAAADDGGGNHVVGMWAGAFVGVFFGLAFGRALRGSGWTQFLVRKWTTKGREPNG